MNSTVRKDELFFHLITLLREGTLNYRWRAAEALGEEGDQRAVGPLIEALSDPHVDVSWIAAKSLGRLGDPEAVPHLISMLDDDDKWQRIGAAEGLGGIADPEAVESLATLLARDPDRLVREKAAWALGEIGGDAAEDALLSAEGDESERVRKSVLKSLEKLKKGK
ncbi:HEAT repeat domain-containing protein [Methanocalculus chunghsingensis]|uniref:HEAT repeat domain-containing protein n=1 Tax=Methanocalculus chunghsingensis TaxID=156457 RepID=UPI001B8BEFD2